MTGTARQPPGMGLWRARCVATRMAGSEVRAGETGRPRGRRRAPARPYVYLLEARGLVVWLVNAGDVKHLPGRPKTDKLDAVWLCKLNERGMLRPSFVPPAQIRQLRDYTRLRADLTVERSRHKQRLEQAAGGRPGQAGDGGHRHLRGVGPGHAGGADHR